MQQPRHQQLCGVAVQPAGEAGMWNDKAMECFGWEGTVKITRFHVVAWFQVHCCHITHPKQFLQLATKKLG